MGGKPQKVETTLGFLILFFILMGIAAVLFIKQSRYDEAVFTAALSGNRPSPNQPDSAASTVDLRAISPTGMVNLRRMVWAGKPFRKD